PLLAGEGDRRVSGGRVGGAQDGKGFFVAFEKTARIVENADRNISGARIEKVQLQEQVVSGQRTVIDGQTEHDTERTERFNDVTARIDVSVAVHIREPTGGKCQRISDANHIHP